MSDSYYSKVSVIGGNKVRYSYHIKQYITESTQFDRMRKKVVVMENDGIHKKAFWNLAFAERFKTIEAVEEHLKLWSPECNPRTKFRFQKCC